MADSTNTQILIAGSVAAFTVDLLVYPLDTIKTRWQSQDYSKAYASASRTSRRLSPQLFRGLYQGVGSVVIATLPAAGIFFTTYEATKTLYTNALSSLRLPQPVIHSLASGTAELASCLVLTPAEVIKQNAQMLRSYPSHGKHHYHQSTSMQALRMVWQSERGALRNLWSGYTALAARNLPFTALHFPMFEAFRERLWRWRGRVRARKSLRRERGLDKNLETKQDATASERLQNRVQGAMVRDEMTSYRSMLLETGFVTGASAASSGAIAAVITTPTDVVKTRMMLAAGQRRGDGHMGDKVAQGSSSTVTQQHVSKQGGLQVANEIFQEKGVRGLFRGGALRAAWTAIGAGIYLGSYEMAKVWLKGRNPDGQTDRSS